MIERRNRRLQFSLASIFFLFLGFALGFACKTWVVALVDREAVVSDWLEGRMIGDRYCIHCYKTFMGDDYGTPPIGYRKYVIRQEYDADEGRKTLTGKTTTPLCKECWQKATPNEKIKALNAMWEDQDWHWGSRGIDGWREKMRQTIREHPED